MFPQKKTYPKKYLFIQVLFTIIFLIYPITLIESKTETENYIKEKNEAIQLIVNKYWKSDISTYSEFMIYTDPIPNGARIRVAFDSDEEILCDQQCWLFVVDHLPNFPFSHSIEFGVINPQTNSIQKIISANWWPQLINKNKNELLYLSSNDWEKFKIKQIIEFTNSENKSLRFKPLISKSLPDSCIRDSKKQRPDREPLVFNPINIQEKENKLWAIIINGHTDNGNNNTFSIDAKDMWSTVKAYDVPDKQILYITPPISKQKLNRLVRNFYFDKKKGMKIPKDGKLLFFISTHGGRGEKEELLIESINFYNENLGHSDIADLLNPIQCRTQFIVINACFSSSFIKPLTKNNPNKINRVIIASSESTSPPDLDSTDKDLICDKNSKDRGSEFASGFIEAFRNIDADTISPNNKISIEEAFNFAKENAFCADNYATITCAGYYKASYFPEIRFSYNPCKYLFWKED